MLCSLSATKFHTSIPNSQACSKDRLRAGYDEVSQMEFPISSQSRSLSSAAFYNNGIWRFARPFSISEMEGRLCAGPAKDLWSERPTISPQPRVRIAAARPTPIRIAVFPTTPHSDAIITPRLALPPHPTPITCYRDAKTTSGRNSEEISRNLALN